MLFDVSMYMNLHSSNIMPSKKSLPFLFNPYLHKQIKLCLLFYFSVYFIICIVQHNVKYLLTYTFIFRIVLLPSNYSFSINDLGLHLTKLWRSNCLFSFPWGPTSQCFGNKTFHESGRFVGLWVAQRDKVRSGKASSHLDTVGNL